MSPEQIREAIRVPISGGSMLVTGRSAEILVEAARAYADLLDTGALIVRRDEDGDWPNAPKLSGNANRIGKAYLDALAAGEDKK